MAEEVRGSNPRWWDDVQEAAESAGLPGSYDYGCQRCCWMGHLLTNWMGDDGFLTKMYVELRLFNVVGDTTWCRGKVIAKREESDERLVDLEIGAKISGERSPPRAPLLSGCPLNRPPTEARVRRFRQPPLLITNL